MAVDFPDRSASANFHSSRSSAADLSNDIASEKQAVSRGATLVESGAPRWRLVLLIWTIPASIAVLQSVASYALRGALAVEWPYAALQFPRWMSWALVTPLVFWLARRFPIRSPGLVKAIAVHFVAAMLISAVIETIWLQASLLVSQRLNPAETVNMSMAAIVSITVLSRLLGALFTYGALLGVAVAMQYQQRLREREVQAVELEAQLANAQVHALKMQVHPHFLFNTLHAVTVLIRENPAMAVRMVTRLGDLLRLTLSRAQSAEVSLGKEIEILTLYLEIERIRFQDRLQVNYDVDTGVLDAQLPDLILQPLVENAIKHGIGTRAGKGVIEVRARRESSWLVVEIHDDGTGLHKNHPQREGIGLATTRARLERMYGSEHEFTLSARASGGCIARMRIPYKKSASASASVEVGVAQ